MVGLVIVVLIATIVACGIWWMRTMESFHRSPWIPVLVAALVAVPCIAFLLYDYTQTEVRTVLIEGKDRGGDDGSYRVYTDGDTLAVEDIWFSIDNRRFDSADLFGDLMVCHRYRITVRGWEFGPFSMMPNIDRILEDMGPVPDCEPRV